MKLPFSKYQGTGNDFVMIDQRRKKYIKKTDTAIIQHLCDRRFGIGADGLILLQYPRETGISTREKGDITHKNVDFEMIYFNADGRESSMCGNGGRCLVSFAHALKMFDKTCVFNAIDGLHAAKLEDTDTWISLKMIDVSTIEIGKDYYLLNTGSPHFVVFVEDLTDINVYENGREIRYSERFFTEGVNVNFVEIGKDGSLEVATYERGVEAETFSCGTGVTAAAIAYAMKKDINLTKNTVFEVAIQTKGGKLHVGLQRGEEGKFTDIWLSGPAVEVFSGVIDIG